MAWYKEMTEQQKQNFQKNRCMCSSVNSNLDFILVL